MSYEIRIAKLDEMKLVQKFLNFHWKENHILCNDDQLMLWQHADEINKNLNYVIAYDSLKNEIDGLIGFIPTSHFDTTIKDDSAWIAIWKIRDGVEKPGLGVMLYRQLMKELNLKAIGGYAISDVAFKIYKMLRFTNGRMDHFFIKNLERTSFSIADFSNDKNNYANGAMPSECYTFADWDQKQFPVGDIVPAKTAMFYVNRYLKHPKYKYQIKGIMDSGKLVSLFVYRPISVDDSKCLRIVDWTGSFPKNISALFQDLVRKENAEYIDFLCHVPNPSEIQEMGFYLKNESDDVVIPHYFEPFLKKNVPMDYAYLNNTGHPYALYKADGDQDRPNI